MTASLFVAQVEHCRTMPKVHRFSYRSLSILLDLAHLEEMNSGSRLFGYNRHGALSVWDADYLPGKSGSIRERLTAYLAQNGINEKWDRVELLTSPRFLGYVFNPVNFYFCYLGGREVPDLCVAEVNNTFSETHLYIAKPVADDIRGGMAKFVARKEFHVSPFFDRKGEYDFYVKRSAGEVDVRVNLRRDGKTVFTSQIAGSTGTQIRERGIRAMLWGVRYGWLTFPRIVWQATLLKFQHGLEVFTRPAPTSDWTIKRRIPTAFDRIASSLVLSYFDRLVRGRLTVVLPSGEEKRFGDGGELSGRIEVKDWSFFPRVLFGGDVAFGECFTDGLWESEDPVSVLRIFSENSDRFDDRTVLFSKLLQLRNRLHHRRRPNSLGKAQDNISAHYDLGTELFKHFLDDALVYSSAVFEIANDSLETAQQNKLQRIIDRAEVLKEHHVLEIGSGWGALATKLALETGCRVTTVTLSEDQHRYATELVERLGLSERVQVLLCDYRKVEGQFDRIVSVEMLEAVGREHLSEFFSVCDRLLKPEGLLVIQTITISEAKYENYSRSCDWIQRYIFPGGHCPSLTAICESASRGSALMVESSENIGPHYARTLREWRRRFDAKRAQLEALGYDSRFQRMWTYYLCYCEAGFASRVLGTLQLVFTRPYNTSLGYCPGYQTQND